MALETNSALWQAENANELLAEYFSNMSKYAADATGSVPLPSFDELVELLDYSELHRMSTTRAGDAASFENGASIENIHNMAAIVREFNLRSKGKVSYYADYSGESVNESNFYSSMKSFWVNMLSGLYEEGKTS